MGEGENDFREDESRVSRVYNGNYKTAGVALRKKAVMIALTGWESVT